MNAASHKTPGNALIHSRGENNFECPPRAQYCSDRAQTSTRVRTAFLCENLSILLKRRAYEENDRKQTEKSQL